MAGRPTPEGTLVTGGSGLLGLNWALARRSAERIVLGMHTRWVQIPGTQSMQLPLHDVNLLRECLRTTRPARVLHAAGLADVERCEAEPVRAREDNVEMAERVAVACQAEGVRLVHISTDHLFRGDRPMVGEEEPAAPVNVYGRTKAEAEHRVLAACPEALVVRTNFFGWGPSWRRSFSDFVIDASRRGVAVDAWVDVHHTPISVPALASAVEQLSKGGARGVMNVVSDERVSKYDLAMRIARQFGLDASLLRPARATDAPRRTGRPLDMSLSNARARAVLGRPIGGVDAMVRDLGASQPSEIGGLA